MDLWDDFSGSCKQSELIPLRCPVCVDRNECAVDEIGEHTREFSLLSLAQHIVLQEEFKKNAPEPDAVKPSLRFTDAVGRTSILPWYLAKTWKDMENFIRQAFADIKSLGSHVARGHYRLLGPDGETILPRVWDQVVQPGWDIKMQLWSLPLGLVAHTNNDDISGFSPSTHVPPIVFDSHDLDDPVVEIIEGPHSRVRVARPGSSGIPPRPPPPPPPPAMSIVRSRYSDDLDGMIVEGDEDPPGTERVGSSKRKHTPAHDSLVSGSDLQIPRPRRRPAFTRWMLGGKRASSGSAPLLPQPPGPT